MTKYFTYVLRSLTGHYYIGQTNDLQERLMAHNSGKNKSTKYHGPWTIIYKKEFATRSEAVKQELYLKALKSRKQLEKIVAG